MELAFAREGASDCFLLAGRYTLLDQSALSEFLPYCVERGISVIAGGPYNSGILAVGPREGATFNYRAASPEMMDKAARIAAVCERHQVPLRAAALQFTRPSGHRVGHPGRAIGGGGRGERAAGRDADPRAVLGGAEEQRLDRAEAAPTPSS